MLVLLYNGKGLKRLSCLEMHLPKQNTNSIISGHIRQKLLKIKPKPFRFQWTKYFQYVCTLKSRIVRPAPIFENLRFLTFADRKNGPDIGAGASIFF